jgi:hypothetical protein
MGALIFVGIVWYNWGGWAALCAFFACSFAYQNGHLQGVAEQQEKHGI